MLIDMRPYVTIAVEELGLKPQPDLKRWFEDRWETFGPALGGALGADARDKAMRGKYLWQDSHFLVLHRVLTLDEYGLIPQKTWKQPGEDRLLHTPDEFRALLRVMKAKHKDPLHLIKIHSDPRLTFEVYPANVSLMLEGAEPYLLSSDGRLVVPAASPICFAAVPQVEGYLWFLSRHSEERTSILNEHLQHPRRTIFPAYRLVSSPARNSAGTPGDRELVVINWSKYLDLADYELADVLRRDDALVSDAELRRLGVAVADSAQNTDEAKHVWASVMPIRISV